MRTLISSLVIFMLGAPIAAFALDYTDRSSRYSDAPFSRSEAAGISLLTNMDVVGGNPDGTFAPKRTLNRAEFVKIALLLDGAAVDFETMSTADRRCFPDVPVSSWFAPYVCFAKSQGIVGGYPDGFFRPEKPVLYAEALKILGERFGYELGRHSGDQWYTPYLRAAQEHGTTLPVSLDIGAAITRGQMARLAAAFAAESRNEIDLYRAAERWQVISPHSSSSSSAESSASSSSSSGSSVSSASSASGSVSGLPVLPVRSHFLMLGERSEPIAAFTLFADQEAMFMRSATVVLERKITSIESMYLVDENGVEIGLLTLDHLYDQNDKTWRGAFPVANAYRIPKEEQRILAVEVRMKDRNSGGSSDQLVEVNSLRLSAQGEDSSATYDSNANTIVFPQHQTVQGHMTSVKNAGPATDPLPIGTSQVIGAFTFAGTHLSGGDLALNQLQFQLSRSADVTTTNFQLGSADSPALWPCSVNGDTVSCSSIPASVGTLAGSPRTLRLFADVSLVPGAQNAFLQVTLNQPGGPGVDGAVHWTDGSATFTWTELGMPIARGTRFQ